MNIEDVCLILKDFEGRDESYLKSFFLQIRNLDRLIAVPRQNLSIPPVHLRMGSGNGVPLRCARSCLPSSVIVETGLTQFATELLVDAPGFEFPVTVGARFDVVVWIGHGCKNSEFSRFKTVLNVLMRFYSF